MGGLSALSRWLEYIGHGESVKQEAPAGQARGFVGEGKGQGLDGGDIELGGLWLLASAVVFSPEVSLTF
jgi:hypothetical protein